jgi:long-chain acyl-CoA synthetase
LTRSLAKNLDLIPGSLLGRPAAVFQRLLIRVVTSLLLRGFLSSLGGRLKFLLTGSAPSRPEIVGFFDALGVPLLEAYGLSENIVPMAMNSRRLRRAGSVGKPLSSNEIKIGDDGVLLVRGPGVFRGYDDPNATSAKLTSDGYLITEDIGRFDADGFLYLSGRKTEIIKTSTGRKIAPLRIESAISRISYIEQAVVLGNGRGELVAILTLDEKRLARSLLEAESALATAELEIRSHDAVNDLIADDLRQAMSGLAAHEQIRACLIVENGFSAERGHLTSNQKVRRAEIERSYARQIEELYTGLGERKKQAKPKPRWPLIRRTS